MDLLALALAWTVVWSVVAFGLAELMIRCINHFNR